MKERFVRCMMEASKASRDVIHEFRLKVLTRGSDILVVETTPSVVGLIRKQYPEIEIEYDQIQAI